MLCHIRVHPQRVVDFIRKKYALPGIRALRKIRIAFSGPQTAEEIGEEISKQLHLELRYPYSTASLNRPVFFHPPLAPSVLN
jgi:hypothetical protein